MRHRAGWSSISAVPGRDAEWLRTSRAVSGRPRAWVRSREHAATPRATRRAPSIADRPRSGPPEPVRCVATAPARRHRRGPGPRVRVSAAGARSAMRSHRRPALVRDGRRRFGARFGAPLGARSHGLEPLGRPDPRLRRARHGQVGPDDPRAARSRRPAAGAPALQRRAENLRHCCASFAIAERQHQLLRRPAASATRSAQFGSGPRALRKRRPEHGMWPSPRAPTESTQAGATQRTAPRTTAAPSPGSVPLPPCRRPAGFRH